MNIYDISRRAGVSIATVSRVLNNSPHVSEATRKKVMAVIEGTGYVPKREGYHFAGWYEDEALTQAFDFNTPISTAR